jgi:hypothetical protein
MKLYEITNKYADLIESYNAAETEEEQNIVLEQLKQIELDKDQKLESCCKWLKNLQAQEVAISAELASLQAKLARADKKTKAFINYIRYCIAEGETWDNGVFKIGWRKSKVVKVIDENKIPATYMRETIRYDPDKTEIKKDLENGAVIPGVTLEIKNNIQIK